MFLQRARSDQVFDFAKVFKFCKVGVSIVVTYLRFNRISLDRIFYASTFLLIIYIPGGILVFVLWH
jgi:hypothetical protein